MDIVYLECNDDYVSDSVDEKYDEYNLEDCVLIRATNAFPFDSIVETPVHGAAVEYGSSFILGDEIKSKLKEKYPNILFDEKEEKAYKEEADLFNVVFKSYRSTIHFTINGLVSSHMYGNFDDRSFVIVEPLKYHLQDESLVSLNACDTYFSDDIKLSSEAVLIIEKDKFDEIKGNPIYQESLSKMKCFIYSGNQKQAVKIVLKELGYDSFIINDHGYVNGFDDKKGAGKMWSLLERLRTQYNIEAIPHFGSELNYTEREESSKRALKTDIDHFKYLIDRALMDGLIDENFSSTIYNALNSDIENGINYRELLELNFYAYDERVNSRKSELLNLKKTIVDKIGLENIKKYTQEYNKEFINNLCKIDSKYR